MSNTVPNKCVYCKYTPSNRNTVYGKHESSLCSKCHRVTYSCDGTCVYTHATHLAILKSQPNVNQKMINKFYKLHSPFHTSVVKLGIHVKKFHSMQDNIQINPYHGTGLTNSCNFAETSTSDIIFEETLESEFINTQLNKSDNADSADASCHIDMHSTTTTTTLFVQSLNYSMQNYVETSVAVGIKESTKLLVCKAVYQKIQFDNKKGLISMDNIAIFLNLAKLIYLNGKNGQEALISFIGLIWKYLPICDEQWLPLPYNSITFQSHVLNPSNQFSLLRMLPIPCPIKIDLDDHAYCPLKESLGYTVFFSSNRGYCNVKKRHDQFVQSSHVQTFLTNISPVINQCNITVLCMTLFWLDGYDPNTSTKGNRKGAWAGSRTFVLYDLLEQNVYFVDSVLFAAGPGKGNGKENHTPVFKRMLEENKSLQNTDGSPKPIPLVSSYHKMKTVDFFVCHLGALMDNPERRSNFGLLQGNAKIHGVFGMSCYFEKLLLPFQACKSCSHDLNQYISKADWTVSPHLILCKDCYGYSFEKLLTYGIYKEPIISLPDANDAPGISLKSKPGRINTKLLSEAWQYTIDRFAIRSDWTVSNVKDYFKILCLNDETINEFIVGCRKYMNYEQYLQDPTECDDQFLEFMESNLQSELICELPEPPPMWSLCPIHLAVETPMHLQMNFIHYTASFLITWAKSISKGAQLIRQSANLLTNAKNTSVLGFKIIPFKTDKFGGYVAKNWRAFALLSPWCFQFIEGDTMQPKNEGALPEPSIKPFTSWKLTELRRWLMLRKIKLDNLISRKELITLASNQFRIEANLDIPVSFSQEKLKAPQIRKLLRFNKNYCNSLMSTDLSSTMAKNRTSGYAMAYLCTLDLSFRVLNDCNEFKGWSSTYTLLGILRAPEHFTDFSCMKLLYEGADMGEGIIKTLRPLSPTGIKDGWALNLILNYYRQDVMGHLLDSCKSEQNTKFTSYEEKFDTKSFVRYGTKVAIRDKIESMSVFSVLIYKEETTNTAVIGSMILQFQTWYFCVLQILNPDECIVDTNGYTYFQIELSGIEHKVSERNSRRLSIGNMKLWKTGLSLPCYWKEFESKYYCFITDDGYTMDSSFDWKVIS